MASSQLDILALEPFYGGVRRSMLEIMIRCSRHRWTLLKLPPRRIERRLSAAAHWFGEQLSRHWVGRLDLLFTSEALSLPDLIRLAPNLDNKPSVVYFHSNQLPDPGQVHSAAANDMVNLSSAQSASEVWFNSEYHQQSFAFRASSLIERHPELASRNPMPELLEKSRVMLPPIDLTGVHQGGSGRNLKRQRYTIFVSTRGADMKLLNLGLAKLARSGQEFNLITVGPIEDLSANFPRHTVSETDDFAQAAAMLKSTIFLSTQRAPPVDHYAVQAMAAGCWPITPDEGVYPELIPERLHECCLFDVTPDSLASRIQDAWHLYDIDDERNEFDLRQQIKPFDAITACRAMDERFSELAVAYELGHLRNE